MTKIRHERTIVNVTKNFLILDEIVSIVSNYRTKEQSISTASIHQFLPGLELLAYQQETDAFARKSFPESIQIRHNSSSCAMDHGFERITGSQTYLTGAGLTVIRIVSMADRSLSSAERSNW